MKDQTTIYYADFHIHIGRTENGKPVKISGSQNLTFFNIIKEAAERKGMDMIGIIDCHVPEVQVEMKRYMDKGWLEVLPGGGWRYGRTTVIPGCELEIREPERGPVHLLAFFRGLQEIETFTQWLTPRMKNVHLSSQRLHDSAKALEEQVSLLGGILIPAHIFTPYKSLFSSGIKRLEELLTPERVDAVELGLSADTRMASQLSTLNNIPFITNSDAHSLATIAREYTALQLAEPTFDEWRMALKRKAGREIAANYGLHPLLGKYHTTVCKICNYTAPAGHNPMLDVAIEARKCPNCGRGGFVSGVEARIQGLADRSSQENSHNRPPYVHQVPLRNIPGLGPRMLEKLLDCFGTEMNVLHHVQEAELKDVAGLKMAELIQAAREGTMSFFAGGGGKYGKVKQ